MNDGIPLGKTSPRDWPEDFADENGNYSCRCFKCGHIFMGYKRRILCKVCAKGTVDG